MSIEIKIRAGNVIDIKTETGKVFQIIESGDELMVTGEQYMGVVNVRDKVRSKKFYFDAVILKQS